MLQCLAKKKCLTWQDHEQQPIAQTNAPHGRKALSDGKPRCSLGFRLTLSQPRSAKVTAIVRIPTGVAKAWQASDPTKRTPMTVDYIRIPQCLRGIQIEVDVKHSSCQV